MFKRVNRKDGKRMNEPLIAPTATMDIYSLQDTTISVHAEISRGVLGANLFSLRESKLRVHITNNGESPLENISVEASAPEGTQLVDPGFSLGISADTCDYRDYNQINQLPTNWEFVQKKVSPAEC